jgi:Uroporphyrinogen decarboxylase (URO-D)
MKTTEREKFINALKLGKPSGRVPNFELVFFLTMECFGKVHPGHRNYFQWGQMTEGERQLHRQDIAQLYLDTARRFEYSGLLLHFPGNDAQELVRIAELIREKCQPGEDYFLSTHGDPTYSHPHGEDMMEWCAWLYEKPQEVQEESRRKLEAFSKRCDIYRESGVIDGFCMCCDYCFNDNPFLPPDKFREVVFPVLKEACTTARENKLFTIKHTDGNIMPIIDQLVEAGPDALHSLDPQGGVDIAQVKKLYGKQICLIGNVNCGKLDTGTVEEVEASVRYALQNGMPGGGYIFGTSNCVYTGMDLERYELMLDIWRKEGIYES